MPDDLSAIKSSVHAIQDWQMTHEVEDHNRHAENIDRFGQINEKLRLIKDNHLHHIQESTGQTDNKVDELQADMKWLMKIAGWFAWVGGLIFVALIGSIITKFI
jgi:hypothetical protein